MSVTKAYSRLQQVSFWLLFGLTLLPAYCAAYGTVLIGSQVFDYREPVDIILTFVFLLTLLMIASIVVYSTWHFLHQSRSFPRVMGWLMTGILVVPLLSFITAVLFYAQLNGIEIALK